MWVTTSLRRYRLFIIASHLKLLKIFTYGPVKTSNGPKLIIAESCIAIQVRGLGNPDHIEKSPLCTGHIGLQMNIEQP